MKLHGYIEVTVAVALLQEDRTFLHDDMADVTIAFGIPTTQPPRPLTEAESQETIRTNLGRVTAMIEAMFIANGVQHLGQVEDPMVNHGREVGRAMSDALRVQVVPVEESRA